MAHLPTSVPVNFSATAVYVDQKSTNSTDCHKEPPKEWIGVYILFIAVLGIVFNVFVLMVFCFHKKACTVAEIYLSNLAAADLVLVSCLPFWAVNAMHKYNWPFDWFLCKVVNMGINMNAYCSIYFLVLISIDRYVALVHPLSHDRFRRPKYAKLGCLLVWGFGFLLSVPVLLFRDLLYVPNAIRCFLKYPNDNVKVWTEGILTMLSFILPIFIISYCTLKIIHALKNRLIELNTRKMEHKATTLMLVVLVAFLICWVPFRLIKILDLLEIVGILRGCALRTNLDLCIQIFTYFAFFNSVLNPILYVLVGENFRKKVRELFKQWAVKRTATLSLTSTRNNQSVKTDVAAL